MSEKKSKESVNTTTNNIIIGLVIALVVFMMLYLNERSKEGSFASTSSGGGSGEIVRTLPDDYVVLKYNGGELRAGEINKKVESRLKQLAEEAIEAYKRVGENAVVEKILGEEAKKRGVPNVQALFDSLGAPAAVSDADVKAFIKQNNLEKGYKDPQTGKMKKVSNEEIKAHLSSRSKMSQRQDFIEGLVSNANIEWMIKEPRTSIPPFTAEEPVLGNPNAKVVVYEHSDFQCPYCARGKAVVNQIHQAYGDKVAVVFRHLPLNFHPEAMPSAIASHCAQQQGKFWEYHDKLFENQKALSSANYPKWAKELGLDEAKFKACLTSPEATQAVERSVAFSDQVGANSTPTFFVGSKSEGKKVSGAQPFAEFKKIIDAELK